MSLPSPLSVKCCRQLSLLQGISESAGTSCASWHTGQHWYRLWKSRMQVSTNISNESISIMASLCSRNLIEMVCSSSGLRRLGPLTTYWAKSSRKKVILRTWDSVEVTIFRIEAGSEETLISKLFMVVSSSVSDFTLEVRAMPEGGGPAGKANKKRKFNNCN